jgi:aerobic-type carbon monoxide dehydrogenase small subunit (CoxS/CutS family)
MLAATALKREIASVFERFASQTGDTAFQAAADALRPAACRRGRKVTDDTAALAEMQVLVDGGQPVETAARFVANALGEKWTTVESTTRRLARKFRAAFNSVDN